MQVYDFFECIGEALYVLKTKDKYDILNIEIQKLCYEKKLSEIQSLSSKKIHFLQGEKIQNIPKNTSIIAFKQVLDEYDALSNVLMVLKEEVSFSNQSTESCWFSFFSLRSDELQDESQEAYEFEYINRIEIPCTSTKLQVFVLDGPIVIASNLTDGQVWILNKHDREYFNAIKVKSKLLPNSAIISCSLVQTTSPPHALLQIQKEYGNEWLTLGLDGQLCSSCSYLPELYGDEQVTCMFIMDRFFYDGDHFNLEGPDLTVPSCPPWLLVGTSTGSIYFYNQGIASGSYVLPMNVPITDIALISKATGISKAVLALHSTNNNHPFILLQVDFPPSSSPNPMVQVTLLQEFEHVGKWFQVEDIEVSYRLFLLHAIEDQSYNMDPLCLVDRCLCIQPPQLNSFLPEVDTQKIRLHPKPLSTNFDTYTTSTNTTMTTKTKTNATTSSICQAKKKKKQKNPKEQKKKLKHLQADLKKLMLLIDSLSYRLAIGKKEHKRWERIVQEKQSMINRLEFFTAQAIAIQSSTSSSLPALIPPPSPPLPLQLPMVELIAAAAAEVDDDDEPHGGMKEDQVDLLSLTATQTLDSTMVVEDMNMSGTQELTTETNAAISCVQSLASIRLVSCVEEERGSNGFHTYIVTLNVHTMEPLLKMEEENYSVLFPSLEESFSMTKRTAKLEKQLQLTVEIPLCSELLADKLDAVVLRHQKSKFSSVQIMGTFQLNPLHLLGAPPKQQQTQMLPPCTSCSGNQQEKEGEGGDDNDKKSMDLVILSGKESLHSILEVDQQQQKPWQTIVLIRPTFALVRVEAPNESVLKLRTRLLMDSLKRGQQTKDHGLYYTIPNVLSLETLGHFRSLSTLLRQELNLLQKYHYDPTRLSSSSDTTEKEWLHHFFKLQIETDRQASKVLKLLQDRMDHRILWHK